MAVDAGQVMSKCYKLTKMTQAEIDANPAQFNPFIVCFCAFFVFFFFFFITRKNIVYLFVFLFKVCKISSN